MYSYKHVTIIIKEKETINLKGAGATLNVLEKSWDILKNEREGEKQCNYKYIEVMLKTASYEI